MGRTSRKNIPMGNKPAPKKGNTSTSGPRQKVKNAELKESSDSLDKSQKRLTKLNSFTKITGLLDIQEKRNSKTRVPTKNCKNEKQKKEPIKQTTKVKPQPANLKAPTPRDNPEYFENLESEALDAAKIIRNADGKFYNFLFIKSQNDENYSDSAESIESFLSAIFYIDIDRSNSRNMEPEKYLAQARRGENTGRIFSKIREIWERGNAIKILKVFEGRQKQEANLRKAAMIEVFGIENLSNDKNCSFSGRIPGWTSGYKLGIYWLYQAFHEFCCKKPKPEYAENKSPKVITIHRPKFKSKPGNSSLSLQDNASNPFDVEYLRKYIEQFVENKNHYENLENDAFKDFNIKICPTCGNNNSQFFNYLLIDPRQCTFNEVYANSPDQWWSFLSAIFYIGKGKGDRPHKHIHAGSTALRQQGKGVGTNSKSQRILDVWKTKNGEKKNGVLILKLFLDRSEEEAFTREAFMIETIGLRQLCQRNRGTFWGVTDLPEQWPPEKKNELGMYLFHQAFQQFCSDDGNKELIYLDDSNLIRQEVHNNHEK